jgi:dTDP-glucose 4,6-dehydratase
MGRILVTGGAGFIGHHLIDVLLEKTDHEIISLDRLDTSGTLNRIQDVLEARPDDRTRVKIVWHDLKAPINDLVAHKIGQVDYILHLAAGSHVDRSIDYPMEFILDNVVGTGNLLDFARLTQPDLKFFLYFSTDEVFGPAPEGVFYKEDDRYRSGNPYAASKAGAEELCMAYENTYQMPISITHTMNVFGIRQHWEKFIPLVIKRVLSGEEIQIHANSDCSQAGSRHYINTQDVAEAVVFLMENAKKGEKYNLVGREETDNLTLAQMIADILGKPLNYKLVDFHSSRPGHDLRYALSGEKMKKMGWYPQKDVKERLAEMIGWTLENRYWIGE